MKNKRVKITQDNISWGITALLVICLSITFYLIITKMPSFKKQLGDVIEVFMPIILGVIIAYLLLPVYNFICRGLEPRLRRRVSARYAGGIARGISVTLSIVLMLTIIWGLLVLAVPQIIQSIISIAYTIPPNIEKLSDRVMQLLQDNPMLLEVAEGVLDTAEKNLNSIIKVNIIPYFTNALGSITMGIINVAGFFFDLIIGLIVCIYILINKDTFSAQAKKFVYSIVNVRTANHLISDTRKVHMIFGGFISGSIIDSLIIGMITFVALSVMKMPYVTMISVIIGVTNIIPFFGPFIGAVPSLLIILMVDPVKCLYLLIYIVVVQQLDGNVIKPKTLGTSTGLPSFWVLFSILIGGGFFGFAGLLLGVPVFATVYMLVTRWVNKALRRRELPYDTDVYRDLEAIDPELHEPLEEVDEEDEDFPFAAEKKEPGICREKLHSGLKKRVGKYGSTLRQTAKKVRREKENSSGEDGAKASDEPDNK